MIQYVIDEHPYERWIERNGKKGRVTEVEKRDKDSERQIGERGRERERERER